MAFYSAGFWARSAVISASVFVSGVQTPLTAQIIGGWYGHRCHIYSDCRINQLPSELKLTVRGFSWCQNQANLSTQTRYCQSVKSELLETVGHRVIDHCFSPLYEDVSSTLLHTALRAACCVFFTSHALRFRLFVCAKRRPSSWNLFKLQLSSTVASVKATPASKPPPHHIK